MRATFEAVTQALKGGATTYRQIANALQVGVDDTDLAATMNFMVNQHHLVAWAKDCCAGSMEHTYDCRLELT